MEPPPNIKICLTRTAIIVNRNIGERGRKPCGTYETEESSDTAIPYSYHPPKSPLNRDKKHLWETHLGPWDQYRPEEGPQLEDRRAEAYTSAEAAAFPKSERDLALGDPVRPTFIWDLLPSPGCPHANTPTSCCTQKGPQ